MREEARELGRKADWGKRCPDERTEWMDGLTDGQDYDTRFLYNISWYSFLVVKSK